jgi:hypothetical protein
MYVKRLLMASRRRGSVSERALLVMARTNRLMNHVKL